MAWYAPCLISYSSQQMGLETQIYAVPAGPGRSLALVVNMVRRLTMERAAQILKQSPLMGLLVVARYIGGGGGCMGGGYVGGRGT